MSMTIAEILRAGKARLLEHGWCQGDEAAIFGKRAFCAATAMAHSCSPLSDAFYPTGIFTRAADHFRSVTKINGSIGDWNDAPERTLEEVLVAYDRAIAAAESRERHPPACPGPYDWCVYSNLCAADDCRKKAGINRK